MGTVQREERRNFCVIAQTILLGYLPEDRKLAGQTPNNALAGRGHRYTVLCDLGNESAAALTYQREGKESAYDI